MRIFIVTMLIIFTCTLTGYAENINDLTETWHNPNVSQELTGNITWSSDFPKPRFNEYSQLFYAHYTGTEWEFYLLETDKSNDTYLWSENSPTFLRLDTVEYDLETRKYIEYKYNDSAELWEVNQLGNDFLDYTSSIPFYILVQTNQSLAYGTAYGKNHLEVIFGYTDSLSNTFSDNELLTSIRGDINIFAYHTQNFIIFCFITIVLWILFKLFGIFFDRM